MSAGRATLLRYAMLGLALFQTRELQAQAQARAATAHFIIIGVDGLSVDGVTRGRTPRIHGVMERGAWTLKARSVMPTLSSPNWASMLMGAGPEQHGITSNGYFKSKFELRPVCRDAGGLFPTIFQVLRESRPASRLAVFHDWGGFADLVEKGVPDIIRHEHGPEHTMAAALEYWRRDRPALLFIQLDHVDHTGHESGWQTPEYYRAVEEADRYVGRMVDMLDELSAFHDTVLLITSDHGGVGHNHGKNSLSEIEIPWILAGAGVQPGEIRIPVTTFDTAATIAWVFGVEPPECWIARPVLRAFRDAGSVVSTIEARSSPCASPPAGVAAESGGAGGSHSAAAR